MTGTPEDDAASNEATPGTPARDTGRMERLELFEFTGSAREYFGIWVFNTLLTIVTLGLYSAWAKVRSQRYFHRNTRVLGSSFDYRGEPWRILKGRVLVSALLLGMIALQMYDLIVAVLGTLLYFLVEPWVLVRSLEFRARNTRYRQLAFDFVGTVPEAYGVRLRGVAATLLTCGLMYPWSRFCLAEFMTLGHRFGDQRFRWSEGSDSYHTVYLRAAALAAAGSAVLWIGRSLSEGALLPQRLLSLSIYLYLLVPSAYLRAKLTNLRIGGLSLGPHRFHCQIEPHRLMLLYASNFLAIVASLGLLIPWAKVRTTRYVLSCMALLPGGSLEIQASAQAPDAHAVGDAAGDQGLDLGLGL